MLVFKHVYKFTKDSFSIAFGFLFSCGILGVITLVIEGISEPNMIMQLSLSDIVGPLIIGLCTALAIVFMNIAAGIGIASIANSICHCSLVLITVFNYFVFHQDLTF